nr:MAG TPA: hypothetical protein [Bacteriophage sp.]
MSSFGILIPLMFVRLFMPFVRSYANCIACCSWACL